MGIPKATAYSVILVAAIMAFCYFAAVGLAPKPQLQPIQVTQAQLVQLPTPTPPPPPKVIPPPKPLPAIIPKPPQAAPPTSGEPIYGSEMHSILEANQNVPPALAQLGISGTAMVEITVAPNGHVLSARIVQSGGNPLIDQTALAHVLEASFPPFNAEMPNATLKFDIPVDIEPQSSGD
jgi:TonB family protein